MSYSLKTLEFNIIKNAVSTYVFSDLARKQITDLTPSSNFNKVNNELHKTNELLNIIVKFGSLPFMEDFDNNILDQGNRLERIYFLDELLYLRLFLKMETEINNYFSNINDQFNIKYINNVITLNDHTRLMSLFNQTFTDYGEIFDDATKELKQVRTVIKKLQFDLDNKLQRLLKTYEPYLSESIIVTRNNRFCLAVKDSYKNKIKGVIHDISASKQTLFIEPEVSLQINADIELNKILEQKEIVKILTNLTEAVNNNFETLTNNYQNLISLDVIHAKAKYSYLIDGILPKTNNEGIVNIIKAKHPLLDKKTAVPISLKLDNQNNILLITGPNTGGKTVALKTVGLLSLMLQSGILIPVNYESNFAIFNQILADIGDEQSIANSLSTFSSHMAKVVNFIDELTDNSLILLDELGSGTDPNEGVALAIAIIEQLNKKDVRLIVTSHYSELKTYAYESEGILTASVAFDKDSLKPLYYLQHGISGESHARLIAQRLGMNLDVINKANELYDNKKTDLAKVITKLNNQQVLLEEEKNELEKVKQSFIKQEQELSNVKQTLINEQNDKLLAIEENERKKWAKREQEVKELLEVIESEKEVKDHLVVKMKGLVNEKLTNKPIYDETVNYNVNDQVYIKSYQQYGYIVEINNNTYRVKFGMFDMYFEKSELEKVEQKPKKPKEIFTKPKKTTVANRATSKASLSLDLRGFRYEEVYNAVDKAVDEALYNNLNTITIIHGYGTGAVKDAVYEYLRKSKHVKQYRYGGEGEGLNGATVVELK